MFVSSIISWLKKKLLKRKLLLFESNLNVMIMQKGEFYKASEVFTPNLAVNTFAVKQLHHCDHPILSW